MTTSGKTTLSQIGASVWGCGADPSRDPDKSYIHKWNTTANALERILASHNDLPVYFDEVGSFAGNDIASVIYNITGGMGKAAMDSGRNLRQPSTWRTVISSTGEESILSRIEETRFGRKKSAKGGQLLRVIDREIDEKVFKDADQVNGIKRACARFYGTLGPRFVETLTATFNNSTLHEQAARMLSEAEARLLKDVPALKGFDGAQKRALRRFALAEVAGRLLVSFQIVQGLTNDHVIIAVDTVAAAWAPHAIRIDDKNRAITRLREHILLNRNMSFATYGEGIPIERTWRELGGLFDPVKQVYYFHESTLESISGLEARVFARELKAKGFLESEPQREGTNKMRIRVDGRQVWVYGIRTSIIGEAAVPSLRDLI